MSRWIEDPQGREEVEKVTRFLKLPVWKPQYLGKFREFWNELWEKIDTNAESSALTLSGKEDSFLKNTAFNKDFGVAREQVLEGAKLAEILGIQYGGLLNNNTTKKRGLGYYCTVNESIYKCKEDTQLNYAESNYFDAISNDDLLGKLQNLYQRVKFFRNSTTFSNEPLQIDRGWIFAIAIIQYLGPTGTQNTVLASPLSENFYMHTGITSDVNSHSIKNQILAGASTLKSASEAFVVVHAQVFY